MFISFYQCNCLNRMRKGSPQPISDVLRDVVEKLSRAKKSELSKILSKWASCVGKELARHSRPARLKGGTLLVAVDDSAWFYQANLQKEGLLKALQKKIGAKKIQNIQFRIGKV